MMFLLYYPWDLVFTPAFRLEIFSQLLGTTNSIVYHAVTIKDLSGHHYFYMYTILLGLHKQEINYIPFEHIYLAAVTRPLFSGAHKRVGYARLYVNRHTHIGFYAILRHSLAGKQF